MIFVEQMMNLVAFKKSVRGMFVTFCLDVRVDEYFDDEKRHKVSHNGKEKWAAEATLYFKDADRKLKVVAVANEKQRDEKCFAFYVSNKLTWNASQLWARSGESMGN